MLLGYNTNGLSNHDGIAALELIADIGYTSVAITVDHQLLNPFSELGRRQHDDVRRLLRDRGLSSVIETGARFLLNPHQKHHPTLLADDPADRKIRMDFLRNCVDLASDLESDCVSIWSGVVPAGADPTKASDRLVEGVRALADYAERREVTIAFEPEPGMLIDTMSRFESFLEQLADDRVRLTLDVGHLHCQRELPIEDQIRRWRELIVNVHIEDIKTGVHEHLMFGEGEIDFPPVIRALSEMDYRGGVHVELSRHSHDGVRAARKAFQFLDPLLRGK